MTDPHILKRWPAEVPELPDWAAGIGPLIDCTADLFGGIATVPPAPDPAEVMRTINDLLSREPTHTLLVSEAHADRARRAVSDAFLALDVEVVPSRFVPEGTAFLIDRAAVERAWRVPEPTTSWAEVARRVADQKAAVKIEETA